MIYFKAQLRHMDLETLQNGLIGKGVTIPGLQVDVPLVYADYVVSGRALEQIEAFVVTKVLPYYANSHTEASFCGAFMTRLRAAARSEIARLTQASSRHAVVFAGSGATADLNRLVYLLGVTDARDPVVFIGPYKHRSNILPWRVSGARVVEIPEVPDGGVDLEALERALCDHAEADLKIGSFSAASNVTGILTDPDPVTRCLKAHGARAVWVVPEPTPIFRSPWGGATRQKTRSSCRRISLLANRALRAGRSSNEMRCAPKPPHGQAAQCLLSRPGRRTMRIGSRPEKRRGRPMGSEISERPVPCR